MNKSTLHTIPISRLHRNPHLYQMRLPLKAAQDADGLNEAHVLNLTMVVKSWTQARTEIEFACKDKAQRAAAFERLGPPFRDPIEVVCIQNQGVPHGEDIDGLPVGVLAVVDGHHRVRACEVAGCAEVLTRVFVGDEDDALVRAAIANTANSLPLEDDGHRKAFRTFIKGRGHRPPGQATMTYRDIAHALGGARAHRTYWQWMKRDFPKIAKRMGEPFRATTMKGERGDDSAYVLDRLRSDPVLAVVNVRRGLSKFDLRTKQTLLDEVRALLHAIEAEKLAVPEF